MITIPSDPEALRNRIKKDLDILDTDELKQLYQMIARTAAKKATHFADMDWEEKALSRDLIKEEVKKYRRSTGK